MALAAAVVLAGVPRPDLVVVAGWRVRLRLRGQFLGAFLPDPGLCRLSEKAAEDVGFYYAANALGRFIGTLLSGLLYQWGGSDRRSAARGGRSMSAP
jgi:hypothetical protein